VVACACFAAISGSSPVTVIAIGTLMFPMLVKAGYSERYSMGVSSGSGTPPDQEPVMYTTDGSLTGPGPIHAPTPACGKRGLLGHRRVPDPSPKAIQERRGKPRLIESFPWFKYSVSRM